MDGQEGFASASTPGESREAAIGSPGQAELPSADHSPRSVNRFSATETSSPQSQTGTGGAEAGGGLERQTSSRIRAGLLSRAATEADGRRNAPQDATSYPASGASSMYASASASESDGGGNSSGWSLPSAGRPPRLVMGSLAAVAGHTSPSSISSPAAAVPGLPAKSLADRLLHHQAPNSPQSGMLRSPFSEDSDLPPSAASSSQQSLRGVRPLLYGQQSTSASSSRFNISGNVSEGSSSLGRAKSVSSVSSVTSTSSLEAVPFRQAPLGNVRAGYSRAQMAQGWLESAGPGLPTPASIPGFVDGEAYTNFASTSEMVHTPGTDASGPTSGYLAPVVTADQSTPMATPAPAEVSAMSPRPRVLPKSTQHDWLYRNAPGLVGPGRPTRMSSANALRSKIVRGAEKLGIKPLTISQKDDLTDEARMSSGGDAISAISIPTSSVTNAPLLVPKLPLENLHGSVGGPLSIVPVASAAVPSSGELTPSNEVEDLLLPPRPILVNTASVDHLMTLQEATRRVNSAAELAHGPGQSAIDSKAVDREVENLLRTPTRFTHSFMPAQTEFPLSHSFGDVGAAVAAEGADASDPNGGPMPTRQMTPAEIVKYEAQTGNTVPQDSRDGAQASTSEAIAIAVPQSGSAQSLAGNTTVTAFSPNFDHRSSLSSSSLTTMVAENLAIVASEADASSSRLTSELAQAQSTSPQSLATQANLVRRDRASSPTTASRRPLMIRATTVESVRSLNSAGSRGSRGSGAADFLSTPKPAENGIERSPKLADGTALAPISMARQSSAGTGSITLAASPSARPRSESSHLAVSPGTILPGSAPLHRPMSVASGASNLSDPAAASGNSSNATRPTAASSRSTRGPQDFDFGEVLGEGSYSTVIQAWDLLSNRKSQPREGERSRSATAAQAIAGVQRADRSALREGKKAYAIKVLDKVHILKQKKQKYVGVEKEALSRLIKLPGVVTLYWTFQDRDSLYFVLELAENGELLSFIKKLGSFDENCARYYGAQLLDTIDGIHKAGILHRDVKPENILLDAKMRIRVTDFGSAKILSKSSEVTAEAERASSFVGTAEYVSPELLTDKAATRSSDWWAFGCVLYQMLAGRPPFKGVNEYQTFQKILKRDFDFPEGFPPEAKDLCSKVLVLEPAKRLGASPSGVDEMRNHPFFTGLDFSTIWSQPAPELKVGLYARPPASGPVTFGFSEDEADFASDFQGTSLTSPKNSTAEDADASDLEDQPSRPESRASSSGQRMAGIRDASRPSMPRVRSTASMQSSSSSADMQPEGGSDEQVKVAGRLLRRLSQGASSPRQYSNWAALLLPRESLLLSSPIIQRKAGAGQMFSKRRQLVLTSFPRLLCVKESAAVLKVKSEIILVPTAEVLPLTEAPASDTGSQRQLHAVQNTVTSIEAKGQRAFAVHTPLKTYTFEDPSGDSSHWLRSIRAAMHEAQGPT